MDKILKKLPIAATVALLVAGVFLFAGCEKEKKTENDITNVRWHLTKFVDETNHMGNVLVPADDTNLFWIKLCDNTLQGFGQVNKIAGCYTISGSKIHIYDFGCTKIYPLNNYEDDFFSAIRSACAFKIDKKILQLYYNNNKKYLQFEKVNEP